MDSFNFLNKKYSSKNFNQPTLHHSNNNHSLAHSRTSKTSNIHPHQYSSKLMTTSNHANQMDISASANQLVANYCPSHQQELIRHMCLECVQLLCSECVGDHIAVHKQSHTFPTISTLKQVKSDMHLKLSEITELMFEEKNHPKNINNDVDKIRKEAGQKIDNLRREIIDSVNLWVEDLRNSVLNNVGYEEIKVIRQQMYGLHEQVNSLNNCLSQNNMNVQAIKKAYQIDADKLQKSYRAMADKYRNLSDTLKVEIDFNYDEFLQNLEKSISLKASKKQKQEIIKISGSYGEEDDYQIQEGLEHLRQEPNQQQEVNQQQEEIIDQSNAASHLLSNLPSGSTVLTIYDLSAQEDNISEYSINTSCSFPLNSLAMLPENTIAISGGMISEDIKNNKVEIIDFKQNQIVSSFEMKYGRSSHKTIFHDNKLFFIGGFCAQTSECKIVEVLDTQGIIQLPHQCKWGGPNLSIILNQRKLMKVTLTGVEYMDLSTYEWQQILSDVPFALSKGMQIKKYNGKVYVFGDETSYYMWDPKKKIFESKQSEIDLGNLTDSTVHNGSIISWMNNKDLVSFDGNRWKWV